MLSIDELFEGRHLDREIIILCVRWYLQFKLSFRDLVEMKADHGIGLAHTTIMRRIQRYVPEFDKCCNHFACKTGRSWRVDEPYVKFKRPLVLSLSCCRQRWKDGRFPVCERSGM